MKNNYLIILIPFLIILLSFKLMVFNLNFYEKEFQKYNVYDKYSKEEVNNNVNELINYLKNKGSLDTNFFNEKEKLHLKDVKNLIQKTFYLFYLLLIIFISLLSYLIYKKRYKIIKNSLFYGSLLTIILLVLFLILIILNFNYLFYKFHIISFSNDLWMLNPTDNLINLFPQGFFYDITKNIIIYSFIISFISAVLCLIVKNN